MIELYAGFSMTIMPIRTKPMTPDMLRTPSLNRWGQPLKTVEQRIAAHSRRVDDCIEWSGSVNTSGYGHMSAAGRVRLVHRIVWTLERGVIPDGMLVLHTCDNPRCIKIEHLYLGTQQDNKRDQIKRGRVPKGFINAGSGVDTTSHCSHGHAWTSENSYFWRDQRFCRACARERANRRYAARRKLKY